MTGGRVEAEAVLAVLAVGGLAVVVLIGWAVAVAVWRLRRLVPALAVLADLAWRFRHWWPR
jgi:hypothetical protein